MQILVFTAENISRSPFSLRGWDGGGDLRDSINLAISQSDVNEIQK